MSRDQRVRDNWALLHAIEQAGKTGAPVAVVFNLVRLCLHTQVGCQLAFVPEALQLGDSAGAGCGIVRQLLMLLMLCKSPCKALPLSVPRRCRSRLT